MQQHTREDSRHFRGAWQTLTPAEQRVVALRCRGFGNPQTADHLFVTQATVKRHVTRILVKLQQAAVAADQPERSAMDGVCWRHGYETALSDLTQHLGERKGTA
jgi:DNA-binding CsgD family transcriptional regulator